MTDDRAPNTMLSQVSTPSERRQMPMGVQHRDIVCSGVSGPQQSSRANPSDLRSVGYVLGPVRCQVDGLQTQPGHCGALALISFFNFHLILFYFLAVPCAMLDVIPRNQTHAP